MTMRLPRRLLWALAALLLGSAGAGLPVATRAAAAGSPAPAGYELALVDLRGRRQVLGVLPPSVFAPRVSPDGGKVVFELADEGSTGEGGTQPPMSLWVADIDRLSGRRRLPRDAGVQRNWAAIWSADGERLIYQASGDGPDTLFSRRADGTGEPERLVEGRAPEGLDPAGRQLAFITLAAPGDYGIGLLDLPTRTLRPLVDIPGSAQHSSRISPDGRWFAYASEETGRQEIWLEPLPPDGQRYRITQDGGRHPLWAPDGRTLYFDQDGQMFRVEVFLDSMPPKASDPRGLRIRGFRQGPLRRQFDLMPDGRRFLMLFPIDARP
jgi:Tol biopolymer transport system component